MEEKNTNSISNECTPEERNSIKVEEPKVLNYLSTNWIEYWEYHHGDIS